MDLLREEILKQKEAGLAAARRGAKAAAMSHFLAAAESLFRLAGGTNDPQLKQSRLKLARSFLDEAKSLDTEKEPSRPSGDRRWNRQETAEEPSDSPGGWILAETATTSFADIAGLEDAKREIRVRMLYPYLHPLEAEKYGLRIGGGVLLFGPPGTGKTLLARATASEIDAVFFAVSPAKIMSKWVGDAERNVEALFREAERRRRAVIFIDEVEALLPRRSASRSTVMRRVVPQFLSEIEGVSQRESDLLFIGATNIPWEIDPAALRPGRFDAKVFVGLPDRRAREQMLSGYLDGRLLAGDIDYRLLSERTEGYSGADIREICEKAARNCFLEAVEGKSGGRPIDRSALDEAVASTSKSFDENLSSKLESFAREHRRQGGEHRRG